VGGAVVAPGSNRSSYRKYLERWAQCGANFGRIWTILPWEGTDAIYPWKRTGPGKANDGGLKFNLDKWDPKFWERVIDSVKYANKLDIVLQFMLFDDCGLEKAKRRWFQHPFNPDNNVNSLDLPNGNVDARNAFYNLNNSVLLSYQEKYVSYAIQLLSSEPNLIFEIANETSAPWIWQKHFIDLVNTSCENLISNNPFVHVAENLECPNLDIINVHNLFASDVFQWFRDNHEYKKILKYDEQYIGEQSSPSIRRIAWSTLTGGGHINWDEPGNDNYTCMATKSLAHFIKLFSPNFTEMIPNDDIVIRGDATAFYNSGHEYIFYSYEDEYFMVLLPKGKYKISWYDPHTGEIFSDSLQHPGGPARFNKPKKYFNLAYKIIKFTSSLLPQDHLIISNDWVLYLKIN
jgi:hypothetical protein